MLKQFQRLRNKHVKIVYKETENSRPYVSEGKLVDANPSFTVIQSTKNG